MVETLGASHLASDGYEVQRTNNFEFRLTGLSEITGSTEHVRELALAVDGAFLPSEESATQELNYANFAIKVAGTTTYSGGSLVLKDVISATSDIESIVTKWRKSVYDPQTDKVGLAFNYKKDARVIQYAPDGSMERIWKLVGVWPRSVNFGNLDYSSGGAIKTIEVGLEYDKAYRIDSSGNPL